MALLYVLLSVTLLAFAAADRAGKCPTITPTLHTLDLSQEGGIYYSVERKPNAIDTAICTRSSGVGSEGKLTSKYLGYIQKNHVILNGTIVATQPDPINRPTFIKEEVESAGVTYTYYFTMIAKGELDSETEDKIKWSAAYNCTEPTGSGSNEAQELIYVASSVPTLSDDQLIIVNLQLLAMGIDTNVLEVVSQPDNCPDF